MKAKIIKDVWYPYYSIYPGEEIDVPLGKIRWIERVRREFSKVQSYLGELYKGGDVE